MADKKTTTQAAEQAALDPPAAVRNDIPLLTEKTSNVAFRASAARKQAVSVLSCCFTRTPASICGFLTRSSALGTGNEPMK